ncbi:hypothetical protein GGS24DRAFT_113172 [Hypoxylon argillaceum]|nr:hypothetical protein GGS24DRAFT_113172 [Hypoxylon argillaceum]
MCRRRDTACEAVIWQSHRFIEILYSVLGETRHSCQATLPIPPTYIRSGLDIRILIIHKRQSTCLWYVRERERERKIELPDSCFFHLFVCLSVCLFYRLVAEPNHYSLPTPCLSLLCLTQSRYCLPLSIGAAHSVPAYLGLHPSIHACRSTW